ncbi:hypothetical protein HanOQP8_Chr05g0172011 [Helianthus annuus]|nr:hypothetical protein HanHA89_Chr05g0174101 [Helianthus annuus]KAJ0745951.1 hypothetical protein HanOQP8_Chr05g0172011 [Helianthus annuus]
MKNSAAKLDNTRYHRNWITAARSRGLGSGVVTCANTGDLLEATNGRSIPMRQGGYPWLSPSGPRPISPSPLTPLRL